MAIVLDTSVVVAVLDRDEARHGEVRAWLEATDDALVTTPLALTEIDYLVRRHLGQQAAQALWSDFESGAYAVRWWADALAETIDTARRFRHVDIGLVDASLVALAARLGTERVATLDERHFRRLTGTRGTPFTVLPSDSS